MNDIGGGGGGGQEILGSIHHPLAISWRISLHASLALAQSKLEKFKGSV